MCLTELFSLQLRTRLHWLNLSLHTVILASQKKKQSGRGGNAIIAEIQDITYTDVHAYDHTAHYAVFTAEAVPTGLQIYHLYSVFHLLEVSLTKVNNTVLI